MAECRNCDLNVVIVVCGGRCVDVHNLLDMRQMFQSMLPPAPPPHNSTPLYDPLPPSGTPYDALSTFDVSERFLSSLNLAHSQGNSHGHHNTGGSSSSNHGNKDLSGGNSGFSAPTEPDLFYGSPSRYEQLVSSYNHMFPSMTKSGSDPIGGGGQVLKPSSNNGNILQETTAKFGYHHQQQQYRNEGGHALHQSMPGGGGLLNEHQQQQHQMLHQQQQQQQNSYLGNTNDLMSSPVGSQHSDKENRLLPSDN